MLKENCLDLLQITAGESVFFINIFHKCHKFAGVELLGCFFFFCNNRNVCPGFLVHFLSRARKVCSQYGFVVEFTGVGHAPPGLQESVGFCTQIGVFHRVRGEVGVNSESDEQLLSHTLVSRSSCSSVHL